MALVKTLDKFDLQAEFRAYDRDYYSLEGYEAIIDLFEECDCGKNTDLDVIAICCDFNEYDWEYIKDEYSNLDDVVECETFDELLEALNYYTWAVPTTDGNILYQVF